MTAPLQYGTPPPGDPTAVMGRRTLAWIVDLLLYAAIVGAGFASMAEYTEIPPGIAEEDACDILEEQNPDAPDACIALDDTVYLLDTGEAGVQTMLSLGWFVLFVVLQGLTGGSPGKLLFGLRVVDAQGTRCGIGKSLGRTVMWIVDAAPWIIPLVGPITAFTSTGHRRVGDLAAGTYVVSSSRVGQPIEPAGAASQPWGAPAPPGAGWAPPVAPPTAPPSGPPTTPPPAGSGRWSSPVSPDEPDLDIRDLEVPEPTERFDVSPPEVAADPDWSRTPDLGVEAPPETGRAPEEPDLSPPTLPDIDEPATRWEPPTTPGEGWADPSEPPLSEPPLSEPPLTAPTPEPQPEPAPFAAPGAESPSTPPTEQPAAEPTPQELPPPQWDQARNTYIQWDPNRQAWLQWDAGRQHWKPIDT